MLNHSTVMTAAWASYRKVAVAARYGRFCRRLFGRVLRMAWINARAEAARQRSAAVIIVPVEPSALEMALETVRYLPAHMSAARAADAIRARFALHA